MPTAEGNGKLQAISLRDEVYARLRRRILRHDYPPGYRFDLSALEEQLGISRTPLKEALHRLAADGLVEIRPRRGTFVTTLDPRGVAESFEVRRILECGIVDQVVDGASDADLAALEAIHQDMGALLQESDYQAVVQTYIELDRKLHLGLVRLCGNRRLEGIYERIDTHLQIARVKQRFNAADSNETQREHAAILKALAGRDAAHLRSAIEAHIEAARKRIMRALEHEG